MFRSKQSAGQIIRKLSVSTHKIRFIEARI